VLFLAIALHACVNASAQPGAAINSSGNPPHPSAMLDVSSDQSGFLLPRLTTAQRDAIADPAEGLLIFNTTNKCFEFYAFGAWQAGNCASCPPVGAPSEGVHAVTQNSVQWNWTAVSGAMGYRYGTTGDYGSSTDAGQSLGWLQTGLNCGGNYTLYVWAYSSCGYSPVTVLSASAEACPNSCGSSFTDARDSKTYATVLINGQCWMAQGLNYGTRINSATAQSNNSVAEKYCYNNDEANCTTYGGLYQWAEAVQYQNGATNSASWSPVPSGNVIGLCPAGWHLPSDAEVISMVSSLGGVSVAGGKMKHAGFTYWTSPNTGADNISGFTSLGGGNISGGTSTQLGINNPFWTSTQSNSSGARFHMTAYNSAQAWTGDGGKTYGYMIRCIRD
jgi:uncharacterized protein (TIGR02145 family)